MSLSITLNPCSTTLAMHGTSHTTCSYSLSGTVNLSLTQPKSLIPTSLLGSKSRPSEIVLTSLVVTFEGKAEHGRPGETYSAVRLCTVSEEIVKTPIALSVNSDENTGPSQYSIIFDLLTIPGWLPATIHSTDSDKYSTALTSYSLFATATYRVRDPPSNPSSLLSVLQFCSPVWTRTRTAQAPRVEIQVNRHFVSAPPPDEVPASHTSLFPNTTYAVSARAKETSPIPDTIISKLGMMAYIPSMTATSETSIPITIKARYEGEPAVVIEHIDVAIEQIETFLSEPDNVYTSQFPLPSAQPPTHPLLHRSPIEAMDGLGCLFGDTPRCWVKTRPLLAEGAPSRYYLDNQDGEEVEQSSVSGNAGWRLVASRGWSKIELNASISPFGSSKSSRSLSSKQNILLPKFNSPFLHVNHMLRLGVHVVCEGDKRDVIDFSLPLHFVDLPPQINRSRPVSPSPAESSLAVPALSSSASSSAETTPLSSPGYSYSPLSLPAYTQLFYDDGEARIDPFRGIPPAYLDGMEEGGRKISKPEFVPVGTQSLDLDRIEWLMD